MKTLHSGSLNVNAGGPAMSMSLTLKGLEKAGVKTVGLCEEIASDGKLIAPDLNIRFTHRGKYGTFAYVDNIYECLKKEADVDIYHIHGTWMYHGLAVSRYAHKTGRTYVVSPRGMLYPQALAHHALLKKVMMEFYQKDVFSEAACIQATCKEEMEHYRALGFKNPVAVLPNPIDINEIIDREIPNKPIYKVGYLGRLHPRKRVERLIYAFSELREELKDCHLMIIGGGDEIYRAFLEAEVKRLDVKNVEFTGFLTGKEKDDAITGLSLLVVPSDFENFGNIVTEALVRGVPVIASKGMPWQELEECHCGWWIDNDQNSINQTLLEAVTIPNEERLRMGMNGKRLMRENYSVEVLGEKMKRLYEWILNGGYKPEFVYE
ncbi:glycosyltransferase [Bacteroides rodentium]|uniref:glycosyltransferase n=1 Tax=Bacteroides rodentium TaxID=691816 RepID=UPI00046F6528|nr:glycosyltransferase [Bacteroides rodentium]